MAAILLTGGSSFTGLWIAEALDRAGHRVTAPLRRRRAAYEGLRAERVARLAASAEVVFDAPFASEPFLALAGSGAFSLLAHHAADIENYRSASYDAVEGFARNIRGAQAVLRAFATSGGQAVIATSTYFEAGEAGDGPQGLALSPYGLSKGLTTEALRHFAHWAGLRFGRFVISGPFGPMEEGRMAWSLFQRWFEGQPGVVRTPAYVRDNIPVDLLADAYADLAAELLAGAGAAARRPAGFVGTQGEFAERLATAMRPRLGLECAVKALPQTEFPEPRVRVNPDPWIKPGWDQGAFWDAYAAYYRRLADDGLLGTPA